MSSMNSKDLNELGVKLMTQGKPQLAIEMWNEAHNLDPIYSTPALNIFNFFKQQNNLVQAREWLIRYLDRPVTGFTIGSVSQLQVELSNIEKQLNLAPGSAPQPVPDKK